MTISIGTPPVALTATADTGSDLTWTRCFPCHDCPLQSSDLFNPELSRSYQDLNCNSPTCQSLPHSSCSVDGNCRYSYHYSDDSSSWGSLALETITLDSSKGRPAIFNNFLFGCGHDNGGTFKGSGVVGLGRGPYSFLSQLGSIGRKFSYCLTTNMMHSSKLTFGGDSTLSGNGVASTPLVSISDQETVYRVTLQGMSVNGHRISLGDEYCSSCHGNMIIDSGTRLTLLPQSFFNVVALAIDSAMQHVVSIDDRSSNEDLHKYCYDARGISDVSLPNITVHFKDADLELKFHNVFMPGDGQDVWCLAFAAIQDSDSAIFGNVAQRNFRVGFDLHDDKGTVSFSPINDCSIFPS
ncbi:hypothetical protein Tsubulata_018919 [Turnera subulata]|uniref:Peptidase A1 domain-containing protein n=1 Tax=Turnera subulata TaxID=218843 RepID=A0A9Q0JET3_9ROSI|nr:hypothetical protein Tsubulata_018919 [Turnera subulata]